MTLPRRRVFPFTQVTTLDHGVILGMYPGEDPTFGIELQRQNDGSTVWNTICQVEEVGQQNEIRYTDRLPNDNRARSYRARHVKVGWTAGAWTDTVSATPAELPTGELPDPKNSGVGEPKDVYFRVGTSLKVGTAVTPATITKTIRFPHSASLPVYDTASYASNTAYLNPRTSGVGPTFTMPVVMPKGVTITNLKTNCYKGTTNTALEFEFDKIGSTLGATVIASWDYGAAATGISTQGSTCSELVGDDNYLLFYQLSNNSTLLTAARFSYLEIEYTMPDYESAY